MSLFRLGVLRGIGPEATSKFYQKLIETLQEEGLIKTNSDFPQIIINSIPAPELVFDDISEENIKHYVKGLKELDTLNLDLIVMVCNTIHLFYDQLQNEIRTPIINLRKEVFKELKRKKIDQVTILGTPSTLKQGLYEFPGIIYQNPNCHELNIMGEAVFNFNRGIEKRKQIETVQKIIDKYYLSGSQTFLLACTEFAVMFEDLDVSKINTIDVLVNVVVKKCSKNEK